MVFFLFAVVIIINNGQLMHVYMYMLIFACTSGDAVYHAWAVSPSTIKNAYMYMYSSHGYNYSTHTDSFAESPLSTLSR